MIGLNLYTNRDMQASTIILESIDDYLESYWWQIVGNYPD